MPPRKTRANLAPITPAAVVVDNIKPSKKVKLDPVVDSQQIEKKIVKGKAAVDSEVAGSQSFRVVQDSSAVYDATLNQSNVDHNNNKFYKCQLIQNELTNQFFLFTRWGRVGQKGQQNLEPQMSLQNGINSFSSKVRSKMNGGYTKLEINY
jgi:poly [ADP-ribose] polymerase